MGLAMDHENLFEYVWSSLGVGKSNNLNQVEARLFSTEVTRYLVAYSWVTHSLLVI